jgi:hypothetical protein
MSERGNGEEGVVQIPILDMTPFPFVWARTTLGEIWWAVQFDRWILLTCPNERHLSPIFELHEGHYCDEHGFEGKCVGFLNSYADAFNWLIVGSVPHGETTH